ncbi:MAG: hypothetical protein HUN04_04970 [Desulfobacter sp.]|nr:MAG: hypothetical protein HUN04_04970 [Desulfobacter sp.]
MIYGLTLLFITLSGFAQMPIFKRYYIADIPGLGWLAKFYITHSLHYIMASVLLALGGYAVTRLAVSGKGLSSLTFWGRAKGAIILGLVISGAIMVVRNLPGIHFSHMAIYVMNLTHLGLCMALLAVSAFTLVARKPWMH